MLTPDRNFEIGRIVLSLTGTPGIQDRFTFAIAEAKDVLSREPAKLAASVTLPLELFGSNIPSELKSCRLSVMRAATAYHIERHPNATQYVLSLENSGTIRVKSESGWTISQLSSESAAPIGIRWHTVPENTWHQPTPGEKDWSVVAFHTVSASELKDDYGYKER